MGLENSMLYERPLFFILFSGLWLEILGNKRLDAFGEIIELSIGDLGELKIEGSYIFMG